MAHSCLILFPTVHYHTLWNQPIWRDCIIFRWKFAFASSTTQLKMGCVSFVAVVQRQHIGKCARGHGHTCAHVCWCHCLWWKGLFAQKQVIVLMPNRIVLCGDKAQLHSHQTNSKSKKDTCNKGESMSLFCLGCTLWRKVCTDVFIGSC